MALPCTVSICRPWLLIFACLEPAQQSSAISRSGCTKAESDITPSLILSMWMWAAFAVGKWLPPFFRELVRGIGVALREHALERCVMPIDIFEEMDFVFVVHDSGPVKYQDRDGFNKVDLGVVLAGLHR